MKITEKYSNLINKFWRFLIVGGTVSVLDWTLFYLFTNIIGIHYMISTIISFTICTIIHLFWTHSFVFHIEGKVTSKETKSIFAVSIGGFLLTLFLMWCGGEYTTINKLLLRIIVTGIVLFYNFSVRYFVIYRKS